MENDTLNKQLIIFVSSCFAFRHITKTPIIKPQFGESNPFEKKFEG